MKLTKFLSGAADNKANFDLLCIALSRTYTYFVYTSLFIYKFLIIKDGNHYSQQVLMPDRQRSKVYIELRTALTFT